MGHISADRADIRAFQIEFGQIVQFVEPKSAVYGEFVRVNLLKLGFLGIEFVLDIADQFLDYVLQRHHSDRAAEFIKHDGKVRVLAQKQIKQLLQRHHIGYREQIQFYLCQLRIRITKYRHEFLDMIQANRVIEIFAAKRESGVFRRDGFFHVGLEIVFQVEINHLVARSHDVPHHSLAKIEDVEDQLAP